MSAPADLLRLGVIGVGHLGRHHARLAASVPGARLVAVADLQRDRAETAAASSGARAMTNPADMLGEVDAVVVAVPTVAHLDVARPFLERGVHVLVEKPMAASIAEADELIALAARHGAVLAVGHSERFNPAVAAALPLLRQPRFIEVHRLSAFPERSLDIDVVFDVMIHDLDIVSAVDATDVVNVEAVGIPVLSSRIDIANARIKFASGCIANLTASRISREQVRKVRFFQPDSYISIDYASCEVEAWRLVPRPGARPAIEGGPVPVVREEALARELADFAGAIRDQRRPLVPGEDGRRALALATRVAAAIAENAWPEPARV
jgi:predicted dehydrogenase